MQANRYPRILLRHAAAALLFLGAGSLFAQRAPALRAAPEDVCDLPKPAPESWELEPAPDGRAAVFRYDLPETCDAAQLVIYDVLGKPAIRRTLPAGAGREYVNLAMLPDGVYFYAVEAGGRPHLPRKLRLSRTRPLVKAL